MFLDQPALSGSCRIGIGRYVFSIWDMRFAVFILDSGGLSPCVAARLPAKVALRRSV